MSCYIVLGLSTRRRVIPTKRMKTMCHHRKNMMKMTTCRSKKLKL